MKVLRWLKEILGGSQPEGARFSEKATMELYRMERLQLAVQLSYIYNWQLTMHAVKALQARKPQG
ncbi:hypothetical protein [Thermofilum pendens]|uniref:Uncharacterized protein n=1 Tax=Thermofilum pendens (strain DSM 2475 / Hrk 5) TaxID=368408 RepID=A1RYT7_THEPD|nr:hypothetical protein [Thermofilum pendens]ABL78367.1 hypothetical protein Tpen_0967 [Thermofilum pendens Hrk 5]